MKRLLLIIIITVLICFFIFRYTSTNEALTVEGLTSDEAIKNIASIYNTDKMSVTNLNVTGESTVNKSTISTLNVTGDTTLNNVQTGKLQLGNKWSLTGTGKDISGYDDDWLRFLGPNGQYYGGIAVGKIWDVSVGGQLSNVISGIQGSIGNLSRTVNNVRCADGWDVSDDVQTSGMSDCVNRCRNSPNRAPAGSALCAQLRKNDNRCWCKSILAFQPGTDNNFQAQLLL